MTASGLSGPAVLLHGGLLLGLAQAAQQGHVLALQAAGEAAAGTRVQQLHELGIALGHGDIQQLVEVDAAVGKLAEGTALAHGLNSFGARHYE